MEVSSFRGVHYKTFIGATGKDSALYYILGDSSPKSGRRRDDLLMVALQVNYPAIRDNKVSVPRH